MMTERHFISLGAGVQSSVMLLLADRGEIMPRPEAAIFADTQWEPPEVYQHLAWLEREVSIPIHWVTAGDIRADSLIGTSPRGFRKEDGSGIVTMPLFTRGGGMGRRYCTGEYKVRPIDSKIRRICGIGYRERFPKDLTAVVWMGISRDEIQRIKQSKEKWRRNWYPLVERDNPWGRQDCRRWFAEHYIDRTLPRSACVACPFRTNEEWLKIKSDPVLWKEVIEFDRGIRNVANTHDDPEHEHFLHRQRVPIDQVDFSEDQADLWGNECEGMCGV